MPRILKRLSLAFAVLAVGFVIAGWIALRVLASNVLSTDTEPVRLQLVADWAKHADGLEAWLAAVTSWSTPSGPTPVATGCQLRWTGESAAVRQHLARCGDAPGPLDEQTLVALDGLAEQLLVKAAEAPTLERDLSWMAGLHGQDDWSDVTGTPFEFVEAGSSLMDAPSLALRQVRGLALLRLLQGQRAGALDAAVDDVTAFARALLGRPFVLDQLVGVAVLDRMRAVLDGAGQPDLGPGAAEVQALRGARLASAFLWHPWVPKVQRERFLPKLAVASRCAAASEALLVLEVGPPLAENYPQFVEDFTAWRKTNPCPSAFVNRALDARATLPEGSWKQLLRSAEFVNRAEQGDFVSTLLVKTIESSALGRRAATEAIFSVTAARPFAAPVEKQKP
ncbi:MAG: hypothetical protein Q8L48_42375 [Archangium sp.]|nr:hypothetical protein [Archangium sp.]